MVMPFASARSLERWITGPSAIGSENGTPSSRRSAPASTKRCMSGTVQPGSGSPAVMKGTSALRPAARNPAKRSSMRLAPVSGTMPRTRA